MVVGMGLAVLDARETDLGLEVTFITDAGLEQLEGTHAEVAQLARVMQQVSVLAPLNESERVWIEDVPGRYGHGQAGARPRWPSPSADRAH